MDDWRLAGAAEVQELEVPAPAFPSLAISPNLEALLEYDERTRSPDLASPVIPSGGLRPAPRGPPRTKSLPVTPRGSQQSAGGVRRLDSDAFTTAFPHPLTIATTPPPNPYINPLPLINQTVYNKQSANRPQASPLGPSSTVTESVTQKHSSKSESLLSSQHDHEHPRNETSPAQTSAGQRLPPLYQRYQLSGLERLLGKGSKGMSSLFSESGAQLQKIRRESSDRSPAPRLRDPKRPEIESGSSQYKADTADLPSPPVAEMRETSDAGPSIQNARSVEIGNADIAAAEGFVSRPSASQPSQGTNMKRTRPLLSHAHRNSESSARSSSSFSTSGPPSTDTGPRISISSTIYPSSVYSHSIQSYIHRQPSLPANSFDIMPAFPSRESFIDLSSPPTPDFRIPRERPDSMQRITKSQPSSPNPNQPLFTNPDSYSIRSTNARPFVSKDGSSLSQSSKPPIPTAPKPSFKRSSSAQPSLRKAKLPISISGPPTPDASGKRGPDFHENCKPLPPTTNYLNAQERADLIRKSRKLAQVFGQTPSGDVLSPPSDGGGATDLLGPSLLFPINTANHRYQRSVTSVSDRLQASSRALPHSLWPPTEGTHYLSANGRRHSAPLSPDQFSFLSDFVTEEGRSFEDQVLIEIGTQEGVPASDWSGPRVHSSPRADSPTSFIDMSEEDIPNDDVSAISSSEIRKKSGRRRAIPCSPSTPSLFENMSPEQQVEEERRRKRDKLAKLHRFLGSRVPADLVLGANEGGAPLPPPGLGAVSEDESDTRMKWLRRRRSSSSAAFPAAWSDDVDRLKEELNDREKAINVRRAQKMEKVFGVLPPQTLYHTRHYPSPSTPILVAVGSPTVNSSNAAPFSPTQASPPSPGRHNRNQTAYTKLKKNNRPGTSESNKQLLPSIDGGAFDRYGDQDQSMNVYLHYQHSLHSLNDIIDRDDRASLAELHQYLNGELPDSPLQEFTRSRDRSSSIAASIKSERRRSLPARTSLLSLNSEYSITSPKPEVTDFQLRRRRAAKLTQFFGVDYRDLIQDVLESIEKGVEEERKRGTLNSDEVQDLLQRLRTLKTKRGGLL